MTARSLQHDVLPRLVTAGRLRTQWIRGMLAVDGSDRWLLCTSDGGGDGAWFVNQDDDSFSEPDHLIWTELDLGHPGTVGCLLALFREVSGQPLARPRPCADGRWRIPSSFGQPYEERPSGDTEGKAIAAALTALVGP